MYVRFLLLLFLSLSSLEAVEYSIMPKVHELLKGENLKKGKYSPEQFTAIEAALERREERVRFLTYNVLSDSYKSNLPEHYQWAARLPRIIEMLEESNPDVIGVQELFSEEKLQLLTILGNVYDFFSKPCEEGEINGIFFRKERFAQLDAKVWYLGGKRQKCSKTPTLTMVLLQDRKTKTRFAVFNTHLSFSRIKSREKQARLIAKALASFRQTAPYPIVLMGDFNTFPNRPEEKNLPFYDGDFIEEILTGTELHDARKHSLLGHLGPLATFTNAHSSDSRPFRGTGVPGVFLDHIYVSKDAVVLIHGVDPGTVGGRYASDHMPVIADILFSKTPTAQIK